MLVAGPSHSSYHSYSTSDLPSASSHRRDSSSKSNGSSTASDTNSNSSSLSSKYNLIKTFAERLNRGTELLKQTMQKAILPTKKSTTPGLDDPLILSPGKVHRRTTTMTPESDSGDSLKIEVTSHFKPIRIMPQTPKRRNQSSLKHPTPKIFKNHSATRLNHFKPLICPKKLVSSPSSAFLSLVQHCDDKDDDHEKNDIKSNSSNGLNSSIESKPGNSRRGVKRKQVPNTASCSTTNESIRKSTRQMTKTNKSSQHSKTNKKLKNETTTIATTTLTLKEQQERADYEFAKKLQSQLNVTIFEDDDDSCLYPTAGSAGGNNSNKTKPGNSSNSNQEKCYNLRRTKANFVKPNYDETSSFITVRRSTRRKNISY